MLQHSFVLIYIIHQTAVKETKPRLAKQNNYSEIHWRYIKLDGQHRNSIISCRLFTSSLRLDEINQKLCLRIREELFSEAISSQESDLKAL